MMFLCKTQRRLIFEYEFLKKFVAFGRMIRVIAYSKSDAQRKLIDSIPDNDLQYMINFLMQNVLSDVFSLKTYI